MIQGGLFRPTPPYVGEKLILRIVRPVVTLVQSFKNIRTWAELEPNL